MVALSLAIIVNGLSKKVGKFVLSDAL